MAFKNISDSGDEYEVYIPEGLKDPFAPAWKFPLRLEDRTVDDQLTSRYGVFGYKRSYYYHSGVDLYTKGKVPVYSVEDGEVVSIIKFTGPPEHDHWLYTQAVLVQGASGVVAYGEVTAGASLRVGDFVSCGEYLADVSPVLPESKARADMYGHSTHMLHFEWWDPGTRDSASWHHGIPTPPNLRNPTAGLQRSWDLLRTNNGL